MRRRTAPSAGVSGHDAGKASDAGQLQKAADGTTIIAGASSAEILVGHRFTADEETRFLKGVDADKKEALRRLHITAVRVYFCLQQLLPRTWTCVGRTCMSTAPDPPASCSRGLLIAIRNAPRASAPSNWQFVFT